MLPVLGSEFSKGNYECCAFSCKGWPVFFQGANTKALCIALFLSGCAKDYIHPADVVLKTPANGQALVYFLRAPDDPAMISILNNNHLLAKLPPESYVAVSISPGKYRITSVSTSIFSSGKSIVEPLDFSLSAGQRIFFHVSGSTERSAGVGGMVFIPGTGTIPIGQRQVSMSGRVWQDCSEIDARGLITISREVFPE